MEESKQEANVAGKFEGFPFKNRWFLKFGILKNP